MLEANGLDYIAEIVTGGDYVPAPGLTPQLHFEHLQRGLEASLPLAPRVVTALCVSDRWSLLESIRFFGKVLDLRAEYGITISVETHRGRPTFNPWQTRNLLKAIPKLKLTCDFSHWCVVTERLVMDEEPGILELISKRFHHIHGRVGYAQGPQVPHPNAPEHKAYLEAHKRWWKTLWASAQEAEQNTLTMTPEIGPDGYLHQTPFSQEPVGDLWQINQWIRGYLRKQFG